MLIPSPGLYVPPHLAIKEDPEKGLVVIARELIPEGDNICELFFDGLQPQAAASGVSIQIAKDLFLNNRLGTIDDYFNHSCDPTARINWRRYTFDAVRPIAPGEEITWNYLTTELDLEGRGQAFACKCSSERCLKQIRGFKYLSPSQRDELRPYLSSFLRTL